MKQLIVTLSALAVLSVGATGCLEDKVIEVVVTDETCAEFSQNEQSATWTEDAVVDYGQEIDDILEANGYSRDEIKSAKVISAAYEVIAFPDPPHDWTIGGEITVSRDGGAAATVITYTSQSVMGALNKRTEAQLNPAGRAVLDQALADFLGGANPVLTFRVENGSTTPTPDAGDPMIFDWKAYLVIQVITEVEAEVPDPF